MQISRKIFHFYRLEDLLLKCPQYPKQTTDLMQTLSKNPWYFFTELEKS